MIAMFMTSSKYNRKHNYRTISIETPLINAPKRQTVNNQSKERITLKRTKKSTRVVGSLKPEKVTHNDRTQNCIDWRRRGGENRHP